MDFPEPGDHPASRDNRGIEEVLQVLERLRKAGIPGFIVGGRALIYYGVNLSPEVYSFRDDCRVSNLTYLQGLACLRA